MCNYSIANEPFFLHKLFTDMTDFLLQFMLICKEKPATLPLLMQLALNLVHSFLHLMRGGSGRHRTSSGAFLRTASVNRHWLFVRPWAKGRILSIPWGTSGLGGGSKLSSEGRFAMSSCAISVSGAAGMQFQRPMASTRTVSTGPTATRQCIRSKQGLGGIPTRLTMPLKARCRWPLCIINK